MGYLFNGRLHFFFFYLNSFVGHGWNKTLYCVWLLRAGVGSLFLLQRSRCFLGLAVNYCLPLWVSVGHCLPLWVIVDHCLPGGCSAGGGEGLHFLFSLRKGSVILPKILNIKGNQVSGHLYAAIYR